MQDSDSELLPTRVERFQFQTLDFERYDFSGHLVVRGSRTRRRQGYLLIAWRLGKKSREGCTLFRKDNHFRHDFRNFRALASRMRAGTLWLAAQGRFRGSGRLSCRHVHDRTLNTVRSYFSPFRKHAVILRTIEKGRA